MSVEDSRLVFEIINAARAVHGPLGPGFLEIVYSRALVIEFRNRDLAIQREKMFPVVYQEKVIGRHYLDLVVEDRIILELKACRSIIPVFEAQVRSYLSATAYPLGLILNFGTAELEWREVQG